MQARLLSHSLLLTHSGLQFGGVPIKLERHEHEGEFPTILHKLLNPQGDGLQGFS